MSGTLDPQITGGNIARLVDEAGALMLMGYQLQKQAETALAALEPAPLRGKALREAALAYLASSPMPLTRRMVSGPIRPSDFALDQATPRMGCLCLSKNY
jgi:hypothetical protein